MEILLGYTPDGEPIRINSAQFKRHGYMPGLSGTGKTEEMANVLLQTIGAEDEKWGALLLDPVGEQVRRVIRRIPEHRRNDVIYLDPLDTDFPFALNPFATNGDEAQAKSVVTQMMAAFELLFERSWDSPLEAALRSTTATLLSGPKMLGGQKWWPAFDDVSPLVLMQVVEDEGKSWFKRRVTTLRKAAWYAGLEEAGFLQAWQFWQSFDRLTPNPQARYANSIITNIDRIAGDPIIRNIVCQEKSIDFAEVLCEGKIVLVNLQRPILGESSRFLAMLVMAKVLAAMHHQGEDAAKTRPPFAIFGDEFYDWATRPFMEQFRMGRNYGISVWVAHTDRGSLYPWQKPTLGNAQNILCFNQAADDAPEMARTLDATPPKAEPDFGPVYVPYNPKRHKPKFAQASGVLEKDYEGFHEVMADSIAEGRRIISLLEKWVKEGYEWSSAKNLLLTFLPDYICWLEDVARGPFRVGATEQNFLDDWVDAARTNATIVWAKRLIAAPPLGLSVHHARRRLQTWNGNPRDEECTQWMVGAAPPQAALDAAYAALNSEQEALMKWGLFVQEPAWFEQNEHLTLTEMSILGGGYRRDVSVNRGAVLYQRKPGHARTYADMYGQLANELCHQPDYTARCKLSGLDEEPIEVTLHTVPLPPENPNCEDDVEFFKDQTHERYCARAQDVERQLAEREALRRQVLDEAAAAEPAAQDGVAGKGNGYQAQGEKLGQ